MSRPPRTLALAVVVLVLAAGVGAAVSTPGNAARQTGTDGSFTVEFTQTEVSPEDPRTNLTFEGIEPGTAVELTSPDLDPATLALMFDGTPTHDGVRVVVPENRTVPVSVQGAELGDYEFVAQRLDTGRTARDQFSFLTEGLDPSIIPSQRLTNATGEFVPLRLSNLNGEFRLTVRDEDGFEATARIDPNDDDVVVWLDTANPGTPTAFFRPVGTSVLVDANVTGAPEALAGQYEIEVDNGLASDNAILPVREQPLNESYLRDRPVPVPSARIAGPGVVDGARSLNATFDRDRVLLSRDGRASANLSLSGTFSDETVLLTSVDYPASRLALVTGGVPTREGVRVDIPDDRRLPFAFDPVSPCRPGSLAVSVEWPDPRVTRTAQIETAGAVPSSLAFERANYTATPGGVAAVGVETPCRDVRLRLTDPASDFRADVTVVEDGPRTTVWLDTAAPSDPERLVRTAVGSPLTNTSSTGDPTELNGTYRLELVADGSVVDTARLRVAANGDAGAQMSRVVTAASESPVEAAATGNSATIETLANESTVEATTDGDGTTTETATTSGGTSLVTGPGFGLPLALVAVLLTVGSYVRRRQ